MKTILRSRLTRAQSAGILLAWLAGTYLVLAVPFSLPGGAVERVQKNLAGLNFAVLAWHDLGSTLIVLAAGALVGGAVYLLVRWIAVRHPEPSPVGAVERRWGWLFYALPMIAVWIVYLLAFWPAVMAPDSINQWQQASSGHFLSGHPLGHTLFLWLLKQVWDTPTFVALVQIFALALLVGWELGVLRRMGLPGWAAWGMAALFALSPVNGSMVVTIWKDTPYSIALFALSLLVLNISLDEEEWLNKKGLWLALGAACAGVALFRHNGMLVALCMPVLLALIYRRHWRIFAAAVVLFTLVWGFVQWPLDALLKVEKKSIITGSIALHHIGAHVHAGTPMTPEEQAVVARVMPLEDWDYNCYSINPIQSSPAFNTQAAIDSNSELYRVMASLFMRSPTVDINHMLCAGELIYRVFQPAEAYMLTTQVVTTPDGPSYMARNNLGLKEDSRLPGLKDALENFLIWSGSREVNWFIWRPATWLYLLLLAGCGLALRWRSWKMGLFLVPALVQSASLFLTNISQSFRYQYPVYLMGLFVLVLLALGGSKRAGSSKRAGGSKRTGDAKE